jgi:3-oxoadipate enol-lactonase
MKINLRNFTAAYEEAGTGIPVLLVHGFPLHRQMWQPQIESLAKFARVIAIDLRAHGGSDGKPEDFTIELFADDCLEFIDALGIKEKIILGGLSMGGYICLAFYRKYAERLAGMVLTATWAGADSNEAQANRDKSIAQVTEHGTTPLVASMLSRLFSPHSLAHNKPLVNQVEKIMNSIHLQTVIADLHALKVRPDSKALIPNINVPLCIIHGQDDQIIPLAEAQEMDRTAKNSSLHILPNAGHLLNLEQPDFFNTAIHQFVDRISLG